MDSAQPIEAKSSSVEIPPEGMLNTEFAPGQKGTIKSKIMIIKRGLERRQETLQKHKKVRGSSERPSFVFDVVIPCLQLTKTTDKKAKKAKNGSRKTTPYRMPGMALDPQSGGATVSCIDCDNMKKFEMAEFKPLSQGQKKFICEQCDAVFKLKLPMEWL